MFNRRFENQLMEYFANLRSLNKLSVLNLGGVSGPAGGSGGPPGGIIGQLAQSNVTYDTTEVATDSTPASGYSLVDNLNHIRYRLETLENAPETIAVEDSGITVISDAETLNFIGDSVTVTASGKVASITISGSPQILYLDDILDVDTITVVSGESLVYNGVSWTNSYVSSSGGGNGYISLQEMEINDDLSSSCDGNETTFSTSYSFISGSTIVVLNGLVQSPGVGNSYSEDESLSSITFSTPPMSGDSLFVTYIRSNSVTIAEVKIGGESDYTNFDSSGHQTMVGDARPWKDEIGELLVKTKNGSRITNDLTEGVVEFSDTCKIADDWVLMNVQLNHDKDIQSVIKPHLHFIQTASGIPNWLLRYRWQINGGITASGWTSDIYQSLAFTYTTGQLNQIVGFSSITPPSGAGLSDIVQFKLYRDTSNDSTLFTGLDPLSGSSSATMFDIHFQVNSLGSDQEYVK